MELKANQLYADKTCIRMHLPLSASDKKWLLIRAKEFCDDLGIDGLACDIHKLANGSLLPWGSNKALVIEADFDSFVFQGVLTVNPFGSACVASTFKLWLGEDFFAVNQSPEARKRAVLDKLQDVESIDYFFLVDHAIDRVAEFLVAALDESAPE